MQSYKTTIIILTYNKLEYTKACIDSIRQYTPKKNYQLVVVDNLSTDGTREWLAEQKDILTIFNEENVGFPKGCNQGIELATGDSILLLNNDVIVTENWLTLMINCLYSSEDVGAVGPVTNSAYGDQEILTSYSTLDEMWEFGNSYNYTAKQDWEQKLKLIGFCMLMKREVVDQVGLLDEAFSPGMCEDSDYSFRIMKAGYKLLVCRNVFVHHFGSTSFGDMPEQRQQLWNLNREKFERKWGFHTAYHTQSREDLVQLIDDPNYLNNIKILDVGCACGATLLRAKYKYPNASLYGIEKNKEAASIAKAIANVTVANVENEMFEPDSFDYIILGDILQELDNPWKLVSSLRNALKPTGKILVSIPNAAHYSIIYSLLNGKLLYSENHLLDKAYKRFFTLVETKELFIKARFGQIEYMAVNDINISDAGHAFINELTNISNNHSSEDLKTMRYLFRVSKYDLFRQRLNDLLNRLSQGDDHSEITMQIVVDLKNKIVDTESIVESVTRMDTNRQHILNVLARCFFENELYDDVIPLLNASLTINPKHHDTLYNYSLILHMIGADKQALDYLMLIDEKDSEVSRLQQSIIKNLGDKTSNS
ncbi:glycosyltransferase [Paenibacillus polymyxa]|uniref:glycosyltransferase n=1 Tax=Paenibacillus polymyxa TaxID=1406 RepID=UPI002AB51305|nr:glycosyltransferase [Paenibacillus polymyxa]MDY7991534.1 glycosyltransferase [Paenibacillus polymyxa]MDY8117975.1 glycosyltransferase [Paenibacillus polymyxa]